MKKLLLVAGALVVSSTTVNAISFLEAPTVGTSPLYPAMQMQMEKQETLDFVNNPENYKNKRAKKDKENKVRETNFNPNYSPNFGGAYLQQVHPVQMQFSKDTDGNIKIQSLPSNGSTGN